MKKIIIILAFATSLFAAQSSKVNEFGFNTNIQKQIMLQDSSTFNNLDGNLSEKTLKQIVTAAYNIHAFRTNYIFPISYAEGRVKTYDSTVHQFKKEQVEFQFSVKYDFLLKIFQLKGIYSIAYTQHSFWQAYVNSAYFSETNYNPEIFATYFLPYYKVKAVRAGFAHQSNGRGGIYERAWNYAYGSVFFQFQNLFAEIKVWTRLYGTRNYNPDLLNYLGQGHLKLMYIYNRNVIKLMLRSNFDSHGAVKLSYSYPIQNTDGLFLYAKVFSGYGESLIDYNHHVNKIGLGVSLSR